MRSNDFESTLANVLLVNQFIEIGSLFMLPGIAYVAADGAVSWLGRKIYPTLAGNTDKMTVAKGIEEFENMTYMKKLVCKIAILATGALAGGLVAAAGGAFVANLIILDPSARNLYYVLLSIFSVGVGALAGMGHLDAIHENLRAFKSSQKADAERQELERVLVRLEGFGLDETNNNQSSALGEGQGSSTEQASAVVQAGLAGT